VVTASYVALFGVLLWQALRGQSLVQPDGVTIAVLLVWVILSAIGVWFAAARRVRIQKLIAMYDANRDGTLSFAEVRVRGLDSKLVENFRSIDRNHDRVLSRVELIASPKVQTLYPATHIWWSWWGAKSG